MKTLVVCTIYGPVLWFHRVTRWYTREETSTLHFEREGSWETEPLRRRHVGVYATSSAEAMTPCFDTCPIGCCS